MVQFKERHEMDKEQYNTDNLPDGFKDASNGE